MHPTTILRRFVLSSPAACRFLARGGNIERSLADAKILTNALHAARLTTTDIRALLDPLSTDADPTPVAEGDVQTVLMQAKYGG